MRVRFEWTAEIPLELPLGYHQILQGIIYNNMRNPYGYSRFVHDEGYSFGQRKFRMFCFSHMEGMGRVRGKRIAFTGPVAFEVSSPDVYVIRTLADNVERNGLRFGSSVYDSVTVLLSDFEVETEQLIVRASSPVTIYRTEKENGKTIYYAPWETEFSMGINDNFQRKYTAYFGVPPQDYVEAVPTAVTEKDKCVTTYKGIYITGYQGIYELRGPRKYLNFLYQAGIGSKNSQGFGMIELI